ncbi:MAG: GntR family transcriptional regulator [Pseudomonadota bacterium]
MAPTRSSIDARLPAYLQLRDRLAARIASGEWGPGDALPSENVLSREHQLSVGTVRRATQQLVDEGLLERRQGAGTFLRKPAFDATLFRFFQMLSEDGSAPSIPQSSLVSRALVTAPAAVGEVLGTDRVLRIDRVRSLADRPILAEEIYVSADRFAGFESIPESALGPLLYPVYFDRFGILVARAVDDLRFGHAPEASAQLLGIASGDPVAVIERTAFAPDGTAVEWRVARGDAKRFRYRSHIS